MKNLLGVAGALFCLSLNLITLPVLAQERKLVPVPQFAQELCKGECSEYSDPKVKVLIPESDTGLIRVEFENDEVKIYVHQPEGTKSWVTKLTLDSTKFSGVENGYCTLPSQRAAFPCKISKKDFDENVVLCDSAEDALSFTAAPLYNMEVVDNGETLLFRLQWTEIETYINAFQPSSYSPDPALLVVRHVGMLPPSPPSKKTEKLCDCARWRKETMDGYVESTWYAVINGKSSNIRFVPSADFQMTPPAKK